MAAYKLQAQIQEEVSPNLIPMIDIMFLLLLFFMLGADMGHRDLEDVRLPKSTEAQKDPNQEERLTINAHHRTNVTCAAYTGQKVCRDEAHWKLTIRGQECTEPKILAALLEKEAAALRAPN